MSSVPHAEVVGGGLAGLTAGAALAQGGWSVRLHERQDALREIGAGIIMWRNALWALEGVGVRDQVLRRAESIHAWEVLDEKERPILPSGWLFSRLREHTAHTVLRQDVHRALVVACERAGVDLRTNSEAVSASPDGELAFSSGARCRADLIVCADGVTSRIRDSLGLAKRVSALRAGVARHLVADYEHHREGELIEWASGKRRIGVYPNKSYTYFYTWCHVDDEEGRKEPLAPNTWSETFPKMEELFRHATQSFPWRRYREVVLRSWSAGRVALVGDAAHAMSADLGQGANSAMSNAYSLSQNVLNEPDLTVALKQWERSERPNTESRQRCSKAFTNANLYWPRPLLPVRSRVLANTWPTRRWAAQVARLADYRPDEGRGSVPTGGLDAKAPTTLTKGRT